MRFLPKEIETLWTLFTAPVVWALHFLVCYVGAAIYCAKEDAAALGFDVLRLGIGVVTAAALAMIVLSAVLAWRQWGFGTYEPPHDDPTPHDRRRFQGFATLLLSGLSFIAVIYTAMAALMISGCFR
jgi:Kef-type K+ transport system membrane component KefB